MKQRLLIWGQAFKYAERKTEVNVSIVDIIIPHKEEKTYIFEGINSASAGIKIIRNINNA